MNKIKIGIVGLNFGRFVVKALRTEGKEAEKYFTLAAVCDLDPARANEVGNEAGVQAYTVLDELLSRDDIPAIGLFSPPFRRAELIRKIIRAGKDVITTKPFELDPGQALDVLNEAASLGRVLHVNSPAPVLSSDIVQILEWQKTYELGRPVGCRAETWVSYREKADGSWQDNPALCPLGPIFRLGIYLVNDLISLFGEVQSVYGIHSKLFTERPTPDNAQVSLMFNNGAIGSIFASFCVQDGQRYSNSLTLNYENGTIYRNVAPLLSGNGAAQLSLVSQKGDDPPVVDTVEYQGKTGEYRWDIFHRAICGEAIPNQLTSAQLVAGLKVLSAIARMESSGKPELVGCSSYCL